MQLQEENRRCGTSTNRRETAGHRREASTITSTRLWEIAITGARAA